MLLTVDPDGTERVLVDPMALDPSGTTTLDAWQPSKEGHLLAYQLSAGGTEESVLRVHRRRDRRAGRRPDRPRALLPGRLAARRRGVLLRAPARARPGARRARSSTTGGSGCTGVGTDPDDDVDGLRRRAGQDQLLRRLASRWTAAGWSSAPSAGTAPRNDLWLADLRAGPLERARAAGRPGGRRRQHVAARRPRRPALRVHRPRRPARPARGDRPGTTRRTRPGRDLLPEDAGGGARGLRDPRRRRARPTPVAAAALDPARGERGHRARPARPASGPATVPLPGLGLGRRAGRAARGRPRGVVRLHRPHHAVVGPPLRRARPARRRCGRPRPARSTCPRCTPGRSSYTSARRHDGAHVRALAGQGARRGRARRSSTATAASASR